jgi:hypothetical protein
MGIRIKPKTVSPAPPPPPPSVESPPAPLAPPPVISKRYHILFAAGMKVPEPEVSSVGFPFGLKLLPVKSLLALMWKSSKR